MPKDHPFTELKLLVVDPAASLAHGGSLRGSVKKELVSESKKCGTCEILGSLALSDGCTGIRARTIAKASHLCQLALIGLSFKEELPVLVNPSRL